MRDLGQLRVKTVQIEVQGIKLEVPAAVLLQALPLPANHKHWSYKKTLRRYYAAGRLVSDTYWHNHFSLVHRRDREEYDVLAKAVDHIVVNGNLDAALEVLTVRLQAIQQAARDGAWGPLIDAIEHDTRYNVGNGVNDSLLRRAARRVRETQRLSAGRGASGAGQRQAPAQERPAGPRGQNAADDKDGGDGRRAAGGRGAGAPPRPQ